MENAVGFWMFSLVCDLMYHMGGEGIWSTMAWYAIGAGVIGALVAAVPGVIHLFPIA